MKRRIVRTMLEELRREWRIFVKAFLKIVNVFTFTIIIFGYNYYKVLQITRGRGREEGP